MWSSLAFGVSIVPGATELTRMPTGPNLALAVRRPGGRR